MNLFQEFFTKRAQMRELEKERQQQIIENSQYPKFKNKKKVVLVIIIIDIISILVFLWFLFYVLKI